MFLQFEDVSFSYPGSGCALFSNLSLSFSEGWTVIAGANGTGKSTLAALASGLIKPDSGCVRMSGNAILCPQIFDGIQPDDWSCLFSGDNYIGRLKSTLALTDEMIEREESLSGGEKKRLQILIALSHFPEILILDEPTNHLDSYSRSLMAAALREFDGIGIIVSHDRTFAGMLSSRTILIDRGTEEAASFEDIPLPLSAALDESERRRISGRSSYDSILLEISSEKMIARKLGDKSREKQKDLTKRGISNKDHDAKAKIDGARLTGKDASLDGAMQNHISRSRQLEEKLSAMDKPLMRKEGLTFSSSMRIPEISFPESVLHAGDYTLSIPSLTIKAGSHIAVTGRNGSGKTLFLRALFKHIEERGKGKYVTYLPQEFSKEEESVILASFEKLSDDERGLVLSDMYRMGSNPSALFSGGVSLSPGEMKKLSISLARMDGCSVLIMDEPTNHLDVISMRILSKMLREDGRKLTIILVSHDESFIEDCTETVWRIERIGNSGQLKT